MKEYLNYVWKGLLLLNAMILVFSIFIEAYRCVTCFFISNAVFLVLITITYKFHKRMSLAKSDEEEVAASIQSRKNIANLKELHLESIEDAEKLMNLIRKVRY